jgi:hypothetical protein
MEVKTIDDILKMFDIDKSKIVIDEEYLENTKTPPIWAKYKLLEDDHNFEVDCLAGYINEIWIEILECKSYFILCYNKIGRPKQIDKKTGKITDYKILVV